VLRDGLVVEGARATSPWNPSKTGFTVLSVKPSYRSQDLNTDEVGRTEITTANVEFAAHYENTDFSVNPTRGSLLKLRYTRDWGEWDSSAPWETVDALGAYYIPLGSSDRARQRVLALNAWAIDTPSWDEFDIGGGGEAVLRRPPAYAGATLGGLSRMRGYPEGRFNDRAAMYYAAEYRHIPDWNPLRDLDLLHRLNINVDWLQYVGIFEIGRVADEFDVGELHSDMQISVGLGLRAMVNHMIVRSDIGISDEEVLVQMTIDQPF
jgi:hypothetical protein